MFVGEMDDMTRGRFDLKSWDDVETVAHALEHPDNFKVIEELGPRVPQPDGGYAYPRYHNIFQDPKSLITHEWQIGNKTTSQLFDSQIPGIKIREGFPMDGTKPNLHDVAYKIFQPIVKEYPKALQQYGLSDFYKQLDHLASQTGELGDQVPNLQEGISQLHSQASDVLKTLFQEQGPRIIEQFHD